MIYKAKYILPMDGRIIEDGEVLVEDGAICGVGCGISDLHPHEKICDLGNAAILPGFVNAHSHIDYTLSRNACDGLNLWDWIGHVGFRKGRIPEHETVLASAMLGAAECVSTGITCLGDSSFTGIAAEAMESVGLRGIVYREIFGQSMGEQYEEKFQYALDAVFAEQAKSSQRLKIGLSPHSVYTTSEHVFKLCAKTCADLGVPVSLHLAETQAEIDYLMHGTGPIAQWRRQLGYEPMIKGLTPASYLNEIGLLRKGVCLAHCVFVSDEEIELIATSEASVAHCPRSNAYLGTGIAPLTKLMASNVTLGLGTDSAGSCMRLDFFEEMRFALGIQRAASKDAAVVMAKNMLEQATIDGAKALGLSDITGSLEVGKRADMIAVGLSGMLPGEDIYLSIISCSPSDVLLAIVDGEEIAGNGRPEKVDIDECRAVLMKCMEQ